MDLEIEDSMIIQGDYFDFLTDCISFCASI